MKKLAQMMMRHFDELSVIFGEEMEEVAALLNNVLNDPVDLLSPELRDKLLDPEAFRMAVRMGLLKVRRGRIVSNLSKNVLLAYLLGRLFSGDYPFILRGDTSWGKGREDFPTAELTRYFHVKNLRQLRQNKLGFRVPNGHQLIDNLFI